jgi:cytochrome c551/c552
MKKLSIGLIVFLSFLLKAQANQVNVGTGKALFQSQCTSCHAIQTRVVGPALKDVFKIRSDAWIIAFVRSSQTVIKGGDTAAVSLFNQFNGTIMPNHPDLSDQDIKNIIGYIRSESATTLAQTPASTVEEDNDPYKGESGFVRQIVYIDVPGPHYPLLVSDYGTWIFIGILIFIFLLTLFTLIKAKSAIAAFNKKYHLDYQEDSKY